MPLLALLQVEAQTGPVLADEYRAQKAARPMRTLTWRVVSPQVMISASAIVAAGPESYGPVSHLGYGCRLVPVVLSNAVVRVARQAPSGSRAPSRRDRARSTQAHLDARSRRHSRLTLRRRRESQSSACASSAPGTVGSSSCGRDLLVVEQFRASSSDLLGPRPLRSKMLATVDARGSRRVAPRPRAPTPVATPRLP